MGSGLAVKMDILMVALWDYCLVVNWVALMVL